MRRGRGRSSAKGRASARVRRAAASTARRSTSTRTKRVDLTGEDIRFTAKGDRLYAFAMGWNPRETRIEALAPSRGLELRKIARVELLGSHDPLKWTLAEDGLHIESPQQWPSEHAVAFRILFD